VAVKLYQRSQSTVPLQQLLQLMRSPSFLTKHLGQEFDPFITVQCSICISR